MPDYHLYLSELGRFVQIFFFTLFVFVFFKMWRMTYNISTGHDLLGKLTALILTVALLLMAFGPERVTMVRVLTYGALSAWCGYNVLYFSRYPIPKEYLRASRKPLEPSLPIYVPKRALFRYLAQDGPDRRPFVFSSMFRNLTVVLALLLALAYGFSRTVNAYTWGFTKVVQERHSAKQETKQAVSSAVQSATMAVAVAVDTLRKGQEEIKETAELAAITSNKVAADVRQDGRKRDRASVRRYKSLTATIERKMNLPMPQLIQPKPLNFQPLDPKRVQPVPTQPAKRGRRLGYEDAPDTTTAPGSYYVRRGEN